MNQPAFGAEFLAESQPTVQGSFADASVSGSDYNAWERFQMENHIPLTVCPYC